MNKGSTFFLAIFIFGTFGWSAQASMECAGKTSSGELVSLQVMTSYETYKPESGRVTITRGEHTFGYTIEQDDIAQYYEDDLFGVEETVLGSKIFVDQLYPLEIVYHGQNYADQDLTEVLNEVTPEPKPTNRMLIWKGPGFPATEQYQIYSFVCGVWSY